MKKTKSASLIKVNSLGCSSKKSTQLETNHTNWQRLGCNRSIANLLTMRPTKLLYEQQTDATTNIQNGNTIVKAGTILRNRVSTLHKSIQQLQKQITQNKEQGKNRSKDYDQQLRKYQKIREQIQKSKMTITKQKQRLGEISNNIMMLNQDFSSACMNIEEGLAYKEYCDEVLEQYQREYQNQANLVLQMFQLENLNADIKINITELQKQIKIKQQALAQWKKQLQFDFQEKVIKNKTTQLRIQLMKAQQQANKYAQKHKLMKIRQILCICVREHAERNRLVMTSDTVNQQGMEIYICRNHQYQQFQQAVLNYRNRYPDAQKNKYDLHIVQKYFTILAKIDTLINNTRHEQNKKINNQYNDQICQMRKTLLQKQQQVVENINRIKSIGEQLEIVFANQSVAIIQHLRQTCGRYELGQIKQRLRKQRESQKKRIAKIRQIYFTNCNLSKQKFELVPTDYMNDLSDLNKKKEKYLKQLKISEYNVQRLQEQKNSIQNQISMAVSKWSQMSFKKQQLKLLYKDLGQLNKQIRQAERLWYQQKQHKTTLKASQMLLVTKRSQILSKNMRQTLRLRINGSYRNKQNSLKLSNRLEMQSKIHQQIDQNCKTRRTSLLEQKQKTMRYEKMKNGGIKNSLTAVLMCKLGN